MAFLPVDEAELWLPLVAGIAEQPPWQGFMRNLVARTQARRAFLLITLADSAPDQEPTVIHVAAPRAAQEPPLDFRELAALNLHPHSALRPGRVYVLDEMLDFDSPARLAHQRAALDAMRIRHGRWLRVSAGGAADAWLVLVREREDFSAASTALLSRFAPHMAAALRTLAALVQQRLQSALAQSALARLGAGQLAFDSAGHVLAADPQAEALVTFAPDAGGGSRGGRRLQLPPEAGHALDAACAATETLPRVLRLDERTGLDLLLRPSDLQLAEPRATPAAIGTLRLPRRENPRAAIRTLATIHGLSANEAALAHALSMGQTIAEAGRALRLTPETARNYSKRIYARTGTSGQADLVRLVLTGLVPFA